MGTLPIFVKMFLQPPLKFGSLRKGPFSTPPPSLIRWILDKKCGVILKFDIQLQYVINNTLFPPVHSEP